MLTRTEVVWRHLVEQAHRGRRRCGTITAIAAALGAPISSVHQALGDLRAIEAVELHPSAGVVVLDPGRILILWAGRRRFWSDVTADMEYAGDVTRIEAAMRSAGAVLGAHSAVVALAANRIADYSTVVAYNTGELDDLLRAAGEPAPTGEGAVRLLVLDADPLVGRYAPVTTLGHAWVDLCNMPGWQAARFTHELMPDLLVDEAERALLPA